MRCMLEPPLKPSDMRKNLAYGGHDLVEIRILMVKETLHCMHIGAVYA